MQLLHNTNLDDSMKEWPAFLQRAVDLACNVLSAHPNPRVGCVITANDQVIGEGWHIAAGQPHAEVMALSNVNGDTKGSTAFVSMEPCCFQGKTGPCTEALIKAGVARVVIAMKDPNPKVAGKGIDALESVGIEVFQLVDLEQAAIDVNPGFVKRHQHGLPFVRLKLAMSLDGRTALANGESKWITSEASRADVQQLRAISSAVVTGIGTVLADDPRLDVRIDEIELSEAQILSNTESLKRQPIRVILDSKLKTPADAKILHGPGQAVVYASTAAVEADNNLSSSAEIRPLAESEVGAGSGVRLLSVLESLAAEFECNDLLVEAGPTLCGAFIQAELVDELIVYIAPKIFGSDSRPLLQLNNLTSLLEAPEFEIETVEQIGTDIKVVLRAN